MTWEWLFGKFSLHWGLDEEDQRVINRTCQENCAGPEVEIIQLTGPCLPGIN